MGRLKWGVAGGEGVAEVGCDGWQVPLKAPHVRNGMVSVVTTAGSLDESVPQI